MHTDSECHCVSSNSEKEKPFQVDYAEVREDPVSGFHLTEQLELQVLSIKSLKHNDSLKLFAFIV
jgi:hypothetical protein